MSSTTLVFVYGSLKKGFGNHHVLSAGRSSFIGRGKTAECDYLMTSALYFPYVMRPNEWPGIHSTLIPYCGFVTGELYCVDWLGMKHLDRLEEHPTMYRRRPVKIILSEGEYTEAEMYISDRFCSGGNVIRPDSNNLLTWKE